MTLPKNYRIKTSESSRNKGMIQNWSPFPEAWVGTGIMIGIWTVTFGILASGIISLNG